MSKTLTSRALGQESVVVLKAQVAGLQGWDGGFVPREVLEIGAAREMASDGRVLVHWFPIDADIWADPEELEPTDPAARVVATYHVDGGGPRSLDKYTVVTAAGLVHNWAVEHWPRNVVRAIRPDGWTWTFDWYPSYERIYPIGTLATVPTCDDDAEALTAAELSFKYSERLPSSVRLILSKRR